MRRPSRDTWLTLGLFALLVLITLAAAFQQTRDQKDPPLASFSSAPDGARALRLWLEAQGYPLPEPEAPHFEVPEGAGLAFVLEPYPGMTEAEFETLDGWVEAGGTLIAAGQGAGAQQIFRHYEFRLHLLLEPIPAAALQAPLLLAPPVSIPIPVRTEAVLSSERSDFVTLLAAGEDPVLVSFELGAGRVVLSAAGVPFSNAGLKETGNPELLFNLGPARLAGAAEQGVWFDEWHHGVRPTSVEVNGPGEWLRYTPAGQALLFTAGAIFLFLLVQGQRFGRPIRLPQETHRRAPLEYITAIANLNRRAGHRTAVLRQFHQQLKRELGRRYRLDATLEDEAWVAELARLRPQVDAGALLRLLRRLRQPQVSEAELVQLAREASEWLSQI